MTWLRRQLRFSQATRNLLWFALGALFAVAALEERITAFAQEKAEAKVEEYTLDVSVAALNAQAEARRVADAQFAAVAQGAKPETQADRDEAAAIMQAIMPSIDDAPPEARQGPDVETDMMTGEAWKSEGPIGGRPLSGEG